MNIAVLISGGVDSSVALRLLQQEGHTITAFYLKIWLEDELSFLGSCPWEEDLAYVRSVCTQAGVPLEIVSLQRAYHEQVVAQMIESIKLGQTPNPDIMCNQRIKFGAFYAHIDAVEAAGGMKFDKVATGHYARVNDQERGAFDGPRITTLVQAVDLVKDQTYFLSHLRQEQLARALFPIGHLQKSEVRELAQAFDLPNKLRKDSQGICFLGKLKFTEFVKSHVGEAPGPLIEFETGKKVGEHRGVWFHTIGQRQGIGLSGGPWYVVGKSVEERTLFISRSYYDVDKARDRFCVDRCHWISGTPPFPGGVRVDVGVKLRHGAQKYEAQIEFDATGGAQLLLPQHDQGIAPGQYAVFYKGTTCLGGATIVS